jgi:hypothetical protein
VEKNIRTYNCIGSSWIWIPPVNKISYTYSFSSSQIPSKYPNYHTYFSCLTLFLDTPDQDGTWRQQGETRITAGIHRWPTTTNSSLQISHSFCTPAPPLSSWESLRACRGTSGGNPAPPRRHLPVVGDHPCPPVQPPRCVRSLCLPTPSRCARRSPCSPRFMPAMDWTSWMPLEMFVLSK